MNAKPAVPPCPYVGIVPPTPKTPNVQQAPPEQPPANEPVEIRSNKPLSEVLISLTGFKGFTGTTPASELINAPWGEACNVLNPPNLVIISDKRQGDYFVPCLLKEAPFVGNTLEAAIRDGRPTVGKMRSKVHMTMASMIVIDLDGIAEADFMALLERIQADGITYLAFTTFSHGSSEKPDMRVRLIIPIDRPVDVEEYTAAWHGFVGRYFNE